MKKKIEMDSKIKKFVLQRCAYILQKWLKKSYKDISKFSNRPFGGYFQFENGCFEI